MIRVSQPSFLGKEQEYVADVMSRGQLSMGEYVGRFERLVAASAGMEYAIAVTSGTTALHAALLALGLKRGDRVVMPACSYIATANAVTYCGAEPVFVDVDRETWVMSPEEAEDAAIRHGAVGIIIVDLYGAKCAAPKLDGVWVLEDACEGHGLTITGDAGVFSFYGNKIVTCGEGGAIVTNDPEVARKCRLLRGQGTSGAQRYVHETVGYNYRMTELQAAVGVAQMEQLEMHLAFRRQLAMQYYSQLPAGQYKAGRSSDWVWPVLFEDRKKAIARFDKNDIETRPVFPALNTQPPYLNITRKSKPNAEYLGEHGLLLPLHLGLTEGDVDHICTTFYEVA